MKNCNTLSILFLGAASALFAGQPATVWIYDYTNLPTGGWQEAAELAAQVLEKAGHPVTWLVCRGVDALPESAARCESELGPDDYVIRVLKGEQKPAPGIKRALAYSIVDGSGGHYATLFWNAIAAQAENLATSRKHVLAYAVAHELIHLLRGPKHSSSGIMKEYWTKADRIAIDQFNLPLR